MKRRRFLALAGAVGVLAAGRTGAQPGAPLVGILLNGAVADFDDFVSRTIIARLRELGFEEGRNVAFAIRSPDARGLVPAVAAELARLQPAVIVVPDAAVVPAVRDAMPATPVVLVTGDLVALGFAQSVARPGGLITGVALISQDLNAKRLEILAAILPHPATVLILVDPRAPFGPASARAAAPALGLMLRVIEIAGPDEIERVLGEARAAGVSGVSVLPSAMFSAQRRRIIALATAARLPVVLYWAEDAHDGALVGYGPSRIEVFRLLAGQIARILRGESVANIPVEQPTRIALVVNLRVAGKLGLTIPPALLARADEVIE
jgi:putative ABC transport system substrate-binding protein